MTCCSVEQFWHGISILLENYHAINKKLFACILTEVRKLTKNIPDISSLDNDALKSADNSNLSSIEELRSCWANATSGLYIVCYKFLSKKLETSDIEAIGVIDFAAPSYTCHFQCSYFEDFVVKLENNEIIVELLTKRLDIEVSTRWANYVLKSKLVKWCYGATNNNNTTTAAGDHVQHSLQLINVEQYNELYKQLKQKHAETVLKYWDAANESTDPLKFIYEDLAIAAYLITLWQNEDCGSPNAFADLGCGNGLLVYILNAAGYKGYGYDVKARKLWSHYPPTTQLIEQAIEPYTFKLPADVDWLIGNHADELSPWLPVLAATASYNMRYFLLPCCAYEFSGTKFQRRNSSTSGYQDFLAYAYAISQSCGFKTLKDRLKIPSTKRLALIGIERTHVQSEYESKCRDIKSYVADERKRQVNSNAQNGNEVKLRERHEPVRNCTQIDQNIIGNLVERIFNVLLHAPTAASEQTINAPTTWQAGGCLRMCEIVQQLTPTQLKHIKAECGGIKTLLRNKHEIFKFLGNDLIGIRKPMVQITPSNKPQTVKKRLCFFKQHHPNGCPLSDEQCTFLH